jgi:hypothetical protein
MYMLVVLKPWLILFCRKFCQVKKTSVKLRAIHFSNHGLEQVGLKLMYAVFTVFPLFSPCGKFHLQSRTQRKRIRARSNENESSELQPLLDVFHRPTPIHSLQHSSSLDPAFRPRPVKKNKPQQLKHYPPP